MSFLLQFMLNSNTCLQTSLSMCQLRVPLALNQRTNEPMQEVHAAVDNMCCFPAIGMLSLML
jgi:hypothetical protein